jgi:WD40 repeat protein
MYDFREYINGPFATWVIEDPQQPSGRLPEWTSLKFTADGKQLVITTVTGLIYIIDAFDGNLLQRLVGHPAPFRSSCGEDVCITPDAGFLVAGGTDSHLRVWDLSHKILDSQPFATLPTPHRKGINVVGFNPLNAMSITGGDELVSL